MSSPGVSVNGSNGHTYDIVWSLSDLLNPSSAAAKMCVSVLAVQPCGRVIFVRPFAVKSRLSGPPWVVIAPAR
jgi:hypothetical protein